MLNTKSQYVFSDIFKVFLEGPPKPIGVIIDITNRCNLKCKHCYFWRENYKTELDDTAWIDRIKEVKKQYKSIQQASWCGGEPLLRKELIEKGMKFFRYNVIQTNGTFPLPKWKNCAFKVSVDGTRELHEIIRGKGTYDKIRQNINNGSTNKIDIACIINKLNYEYIENMIKEWYNTNVNAIHFSFYSPTKTDTDYNLLLDFQLRDKIIESLKSLRKKYGNFILPTNNVLNLMLSENCEKTTSNCPFRYIIVCLDPNGIPKKCPAGDQGICSECGHSLPFVIEALENTRLAVRRLGDAIKSDNS